MIALILLIFAVATIASTPPNLSGSWSLVSTYVESYMSTAAPSDGWAVKCFLGPCTAWKMANMTLQSSTTVRIAFDSGVTHTGEIAADEQTILWIDASVWERTITRDSLDIHIVPHSHNDPGWLRTYYELYNLSHSGINNFAVRDIYSSVVRTLSANPSFTFGAELIVFWSLWYDEANEDERASLRSLIANGQIEFVGGGWTQNDEAVTHFLDIIDQTTLGHLWATSALGAPRPKTAYQADPFGHSTTQAAFFAATALDLASYGRPMSATWQGGGGVPDPFDSASALLWHPTASMPDAGYFDDATIFVHDQRIGYWEPYRSTYPLLKINATQAAADNLALFIENLTSQRPATKTILIMFGDDFQGGDFDTILPALASAMAILNASPAGILPKLNVHFSTPSRFVTALAAEIAASTAAPIQFDARPAWDMLPLIGCEFPAPWTGYYTSRVDFKMLFYAAGAARRTATILHALSRDVSNWDSDANALLPLWAAISLVQHHDAITGDSFDRVEEDYKSYILAGFAAADNVTANAVVSLGAAPANSRICFNVSATPCAQITSSLVIVGGSVTLTITNPSAWVRSDVIELLVPSADVAVVTAADGKSVISQVIAAVDIDDTSVSFLLSFSSTLAPLGATSYIITRVTSPNSPGSATLVVPTSINNSPVTLTNGLISLNFSGQGDLMAFESASLSTFLNLKLLAYHSLPGAENGWDFSTSGANFLSATPFTTSTPLLVTLAIGPIFSELRVQLSLNATFRVRLYDGEAHARVASIIGPFDVSNGSVDAILRISTPFKSDGSWRTDSNGLERHLRTRNMRPWWTEPAVDTFEPVSSNYYPVLAAASMSDTSGSGASIAVLPRGTSHGAASPTDGVLDISLARAVLGSGSFPALANRRVTVEDVLMLSSSDEIADEVLRPLAAKLASPVSVFAVAGSNSQPSFAPCVAPLPPAVELVTLALLPLDSKGHIDVSAAVQGPTPVSPLHEQRRTNLPLANSTLLLRVRHIYAVGEGRYAEPIDVDLSTLFSLHWRVNGAQEVILTAAGDMQLAREQQVQWPQSGAGAQGGRRDGGALRTPSHDGTALFTLLPMQVRTFLVDVE